MVLCIYTNFHEYILNGFQDVEHKSTSLMVLKNNRVDPILKLTRGLKGPDIPHVGILPQFGQNPFTGY